VEVVVMAQVVTHQEEEAVAVTVRLNPMTSNNQPNEKWWELMTQPNFFGY